MHRNKGPKSFVKLINSCEMGREETLLKNFEFTMCFVKDRLRSCFVLYARVLDRRSASERDKNF